MEQSGQWELFRQTLWIGQQVNLWVGSKCCDKWKELSMQTLEAPENPVVVLSKTMEVYFSKEEMALKHRQSWKGSLHALGISRRRMLQTELPPYLRSCSRSAEQQKSQALDHDFDSSFRWGRLKAVVSRAMAWFGVCFDLTWWCQKAWWAVRNLVELGTDLRASHMPGICSPMELYPQAYPEHMLKNWMSWQFDTWHMRNKITKEFSRHHW